MNDLFLLSESQLRGLRPYFRLSHCAPSVDARLMLSGILFVV